MGNSFVPSDTWISWFPRQSWSTKSALSVPLSCISTRRLRRMANGAVDDALIMLVFYHDAVATVNRAGNISLYIEIRRKHALRVRPVRNYRPRSRCCIPPVSGPPACTCRPAPQRPDLQQRMLLIKSGSDFLERFALLYLLCNQHSSGVASNFFKKNLSIIYLFI